MGPHTGSVPDFSGSGSLGSLWTIFISTDAVRINFSWTSDSMRFFCSLDSLILKKLFLCKQEKVQKFE